MNKVRGTQPDDADAEDGRQSAAIGTELRKDVASWYAARNDAPVPDVAKPAAPPARRASARPVTKAAAAKPASPAPAPAHAPRKPLGMSYGGATTAEYIQYLVDRRTR